MSVSSVRPPPSSFPSINTQNVTKGTVLHRTHGSSFRPAQFNPCMGQPTRFAPFQDSAGACVPTLYAATSREAAAFESIFHDIEPTAVFKTVRLDVIESRSVSRIAPKRDLLLAGLFAPDLKVWGISRGDLIETPKSTYGQTVLWAQAIHGARADVDGLLWTSRQCDPDRCVILFEDRVSEGDFQVHDSIEVGADADLLLEIRAFGLRAGITIIS
ncbi:RES family NAD+ phosphorylase [Mesorhizobium sp. VK23B]|uniref:RES family NAD+ phosphorylase n=2 Tax=Mesorhizobium TaxID=68287 RepID=A0ABU4ZT96_9HYPH|nr:MULTISPECIES: RES family NAD+ phosphorylase [unclassified Mesorhizobium]MDX8469975.1 RES family NAD+ phosphorylase [Mesorhizobium sp. VK23B]MDX8476320.1 RES family NAD+ phosphorylase [Mesorhizobium sp. VK23A]MDX8528608.1 RES family NAD+ phosphorylase [Mesorhizobium sp. MSK_1335]